LHAELCGNGQGFSRLTKLAGAGRRLVGVFEEQERHVFGLLDASAVGFGDPLEAERVGLAFLGCPEALGTWLGDFVRVSGCMASS
jgi:hypothetical protein